MIEVKDLVKEYGDIRAVDSISFSVSAGEIFGILGPNGAGKTTTLEMIEGLREPDGGAITLKGRSVWPDPDHTKELIGVQLQSTALFDYLTVREMIALFGSFYRRFLSAAEIDDLLATVGLREKEKAKVRELSGGQQQRLSVSLALVNDPEVVFLDEPTTGLDPQARRRLWDVIREINEAGKTIVLTTHYMQEAEVLCGRVAIMDNGKIVSIDTPEQMIKSLEAETRISFRAGSVRAPAELGAALGVPDLRESDGSFVFYAEDVQPAVLKLFSAAERLGIEVENLSIAGANLEDVFLHLTGKGLRD